jgi:hypothetical protein
LEALACLDELTVMPVTAVVRRHIADNSDHYVTVQSMQQNFAGNLKGVKANKRNKATVAKDGQDGDKKGTSKK